jgi:hypothetical protein
MSLFHLLCQVSSPRHLKVNGIKTGPAINASRNSPSDGRMRGLCVTQQCHAITAHRLCRKQVSCAHQTRENSLMLLWSAVNCRGIRFSAGAPQQQEFCSTGLFRHPKGSPSISFKIFQKMWPEPNSFITDHPETQGGKV